MHFTAYCITTTLVNASPDFNDQKSMFLLLSPPLFPPLPSALVPGHIQNLMSILDANTPSLTLTWDKPDNANASEVVTAYDIYFRPTDDKVHSKTTSVITVDPSCESNRSYIGEDYSNMPSFHSRQYGLQPLKTLNEASPLSPLHPSPTSIETQSESGSVQMEGYFKVTVKAPATSVILSRESGLKPLTKYDFEVRARNSNHTGRWSAVSEYIGMNSVYVCIICT